MHLALLPFDPLLLEDPLPEGLRCLKYTGRGDPPEAEAVTFYVPAPRVLARLEEHLRGLPALQVLQLQSAGVDHALLATPPSVTLCNARGVHDTATSELAIALILASLRNIDEYVRAQQGGTWESRIPPGRTLEGCRVLIVGYGSIGQALADRLLGFGCTVVPVARSEREGVHSTSELSSLLPDADVVVLLAPLTEETRNLADAAFLGAMKDGAVLVNVARGQLVDTPALLDELTAGRLRAALDVTDPEPLAPGHPLWRAPGLLITPHVGGRTSDAGRRIRTFVGRQLRLFAEGRPLANEIVRADH